MHNLFMAIERSQPSYIKRKRLQSLADIIFSKNGIFPANRQQREVTFRQKSGRKMLDRGHFNKKTGRLNREKRSDTLKNPQNLQDGRRKRWRENQKSPRAFSSHNMMREKNSLDRREKERRQRRKNEKNKGKFIEKNRFRSYLRKIREGNIPAYHTNKQAITPVYRP